MALATLATTVAAPGRRGPRAAAALLALAGLIGWGTSSGAATLSPLVLAHDGQSVPAAGSGVTIYTLGTGIVDDAGRATFRAVLEGDGVESYYAMSFVS